MHLQVVTMTPSELEDEFGRLATAASAGTFLTEDAETRAEMGQMFRGFVDSAVDKIEDLLGATTSWSAWCVITHQSSSG